jgi:hypothetical protein
VVSAGLVPAQAPKLAQSRRLAATPKPGSELEGVDMELDRVVILGSLLINFLTLAVFIFQTRYLAHQTKMLTRSLEYSSYHQLVEYLNDVSKLLMQDPEVQAIFKEMPFIKDTVEQDPALGLDKIGLAWLIINRYEAAFVGHQLGVLPSGAWDIWKERLSKDLSLPFLRDVWLNDLKNSRYNTEFARLMDDLLSARESR